MAKKRSRSIPTTNKQTTVPRDRAQSRRSPFSPFVGAAAANNGGGGNSASIRNFEAGEDFAGICFVKNSFNVMSMVEICDLFCLIQNTEM